MLNISQLHFDAAGLIPAVVVDCCSRAVLTVAYMNRESLEITLREGYACFWSRSRQTLWRKGETSGNRQQVVRILADCDKDALTVVVKKSGPACHLGTDSCFQEELYRSPAIPDFTLEGLLALLNDRKAQRPEGSYTTYLFDKGLDKILKKIGEEAAEVIIAAKGEDRRETVYEIADLTYHVLVLMAQLGIPLEEVQAELGARHVIDHKVKQEKMT